METLPQRQQRAMMPQELGPLRPAGAYTFDELYRFAEMCHKSGMFEDVADAAQAMVKIVKGQELGFPPTAAMSAIDIVNRRPFLKPWAIAAKINTCGYGSYEVLEQTAEVCTIRFAKKYPGRGWKDCPLVSYTIQEAHAHGLVNRSAHWKASPAHMLYQRCMGRGGAMYFPELLAGMEVPPDDTPIPPERHASNVTDLFGDTAPVQAALAAARQGAPDDYGTVEQAVEDQSRAKTIRAINEMHSDHGCDLNWIAAYWRKMEQRRFQVAPGSLSLEQLYALEEEVRAYYARLTGQEAPQEPAGATQGESVAEYMKEGSDATTGQPEAFPPHPDTSAWRTLRAHYKNPAVPQALRVHAQALLMRETEVPESEAFGVASDILDALEGRYTEPEAQGTLV